LSWSGQTVLVTGGCSFIGSHLVEELCELGVRRIRIVDDLSTGRLANVQRLVDSGRVEPRVANLLDPGVLAAAMAGVDTVFHLAAVHGGRGYIDMHQADCSQNLALDTLVTREAWRAGVQKLVYASSACVYPIDLQGDVEREVRLSEDVVGPPYHADGVYGWAKLMGEMTLRAYYLEHGFKSVSCRLFTVYGERCLESHAVIALIARAFLRRDPFEIWGDGTQIRNWTYVGDVVRGLILAAERIDDARTVNLGTEERVRVLDAAQQLFRTLDWQPKVVFREDMPTGPKNRVASNKLARELLGWAPSVSFAEGLEKTRRWYFETRQGQRGDLSRDLERMLVER
jgi:nucleoside-diphosphate-sugar epimerase